jgi:hypothetical protein
MSKLIRTRRSKPDARTEAEKENKQKISDILNKISATCNGHAESDRSNQMDQITFLHLDQNIFNWSCVRTDFEYFSTFLLLLKQSHVFLNRVNQSSEACTDHYMRFKHLLWTLFSGFAHKPSENLSHHTELANIFETEAIGYYKSILKPEEQDLYRTGSFIERFKLLAKITKICPVRLDLLDRLHKNLAPDNNKKSPSDTRTYRLSAVISIDRHLKKYCRLRACVINKEFDTSHLTRRPYYDEESFLRVSLCHASGNTEAAWRLAQFDDADDYSYPDLKTNSLVHNISGLVNIMRDLRDTAGCHSELTTKVETALEKDNVDRMNKSLCRYPQAKFCTSGFDSLEESALIASSVLELTDRDDSDNTVCVRRLKIVGKRFKYLMTTSSGVHKNVYIFSVVKYDELCKKMFSNFWMKKLMENSMKMSLRMGLWFTPTISMNKEIVLPKPKEDIGKHTDGCGRVSVALAKAMSARWKEGRKYRNVPFVAQNVGPTEWNAGILQDSEIEYTHNESSEQLGYYSAFQVRVDGNKGMFVVDPSLGEGESIVVSNSQEKFCSPSYPNATIEIVQCSQPTSGARLNFALISLIAGCSKNPQSMQTYFTKLAHEEIRSLLEDKAFAIQFALKHNDIKSFNMLGSGCLLLETFLAGYYQNYARRFKFVVKNSRRLFGVADFWQVLKKGEVFVKISNLESQDLIGPSFKEQQVLVTKEPCFHRGDLRTFTAVTEEELKQRPKGDVLVKLQDVIVFSCVQDEKQSEPDKICGSDLDGDQYFVCWDENVVGNLKDSLFKPGDFTATDKKKLDTMCQEADESAAIKLGEILAKEIESVPGEPINLESSHSTEEKKLMRYHVDDSADNENFQHKVYALRNCKRNSTQLNEDVEEEHSKFLHKLKKTRRHAADTARKISTCSRYLKIHEAFDLHMRCVDSFGDEWTSDKYWPIIEELCRCISTVLDSAKSDIITLKNPLVEDVAKLCPKLPRYPHFHPGKRKDECVHSNSALGRIYDSLQKELEKKFLKLPPPKDANKTDQTSFDTLYDKINELKLSFLFHYTTSQCNSHKEGTTESPHPFHENSYTNDNFFERMLPNLNTDKIKMWYNEHIKSWADKDLLSKEAACTMLWKLITLLNLKDAPHGDLKVLCLDDETHLSDIKYEDLFPDGKINFRFLCITKRLSEDLDLVPSENFAKSSIDEKELIIRLEALVKKAFWRDLGLPYPNAYERTRVLQSKSGLSPITFNQFLSEFDFQIQECLQKSVSMPLSEGYLPRDLFDEHTYKIGKEKADASVILSKLRDIVGYLLCFTDAWAESSKNLNSICNQLSRVALHHIRMYKYQQILSNVRIDDDQSYFPTCYWDRYRIDLSKLEMADDEMNELFKILYS